MDAKKVQSSSIIKDYVLRNALFGLTAVNQDVALLDYGNVVIRRDYKQLNNVRFLSGGAAPGTLNAACFVGKGLLTAAVLGDKQSPCSRVISHVIQELSLGEPNYGVLVIAQANAELFNFGLAVERSNNCGLRVKLLSVDDNRCEGKETNTCGWILMMKILGGLAEKGGTYDDVLQMHKKISQSMRTISLHYMESSTTDLKQVKNFEHVVKVNILEDGRRSPSIISVRTCTDLNFHPSQPAVILINVRRGMSDFDEYSLVKEVADKLNQLGIYITRVYSGSFININSIAILTILTFEDVKVLEYLDVPTSAPGWQKISQSRMNIVTVNEIPSGLKKVGKQIIELKGPRYVENSCKLVKVATQFACDAIISCEKQLNIMDGEQSSGDIGTRLKNAAERINRQLKKDKLALNCPYAYLTKLSIVAEMGINGTLGSIYGLLFEVAANVFGKIPETEEITAFMWLNALTEARSAMKTYCSDEMESKSVYCPIRTCEFVLGTQLAENHDFVAALGVAVGAAEEAAQQTQQIGNKYPDAGAHSVGIWMRAVYEAIKLMSGSRQ